MTAATASAPASARVNWPMAVVLAGLGGGLVDFVYASVVFGLVKGRGIEKVWQGVASGWIGKAAGQGGYASMALGIVTHFGIALVMALVYALAATRAKVLTARPVICGLAYGAALYAFMYGLVVPLRFGAPYHWQGLWSAGDLASHLGVGLVIALMLSRRAGALLHER